MEDRIYGMLTGVAIGDSMGWPSEAKPKATVLQLRGKFMSGQWGELVPQFRTHTNTIRKGVLGQVTDDTEMTIALIYALLEAPDKNYHWQLALKEYLEWMNDRGTNKEYSFPASGINTRNILQGYKQAKTYEQRMKKHWPAEKQNEAQSNGGLMRASILSVSALSCPTNTVVTEDTKLTNPSILSIFLTSNYLLIIQNLLLGHDPDYIKQLLLDNVADKPLLLDLTRAGLNHQPLVWSQQYDLLKPELSKDSIPWQSKEFRGWVGCTYYFAVYTLSMLKVAKPLDIFVTLAFMPYADTDTNASIAGAVMGAYYGKTNLLSSNTLNKWWNIVLAADTSKGEYSRPLKYHPRMFETLVPQIMNKYSQNSASSSNP